MLIEACVHLYTLCPDNAFSPRNHNMKIIEIKIKIMCKATQFSFISSHCIPHDSAMSQVHYLIVQQ